MGWEEVSHKGRGVAAKCERENGRVQLEPSTRTPSSEEAKKPTCPQAAAAITAPDRGGSPPHHTAVAKRGREVGVRRETGGGPEGTKLRACCAGINLACVSPRLLKTQLLWAKERGFVVQACFAWGRNVFVLPHVSLSLLGYERLEGKGKAHPAACCADVDDALSRPVAPPTGRREDTLRRECFRSLVDGRHHPSVQAGVADKRHVPPRSANGGVTLLAAT